jgi:hypothetical protein
MKLGPGDADGDHRLSVVSSKAELIDSAPRPRLMFLC